LAQRLLVVSNTIRTKKRPAGEKPTGVLPSALRAPAGEIARQDHGQKKRGRE
jgi:hypothetical protein